MADIVSPLPGTFYTRPGPDKEPFVSVGSHVEVGDAVGMIEVMKQFTELRSDVAGTITSINVEDTATVMPGQVIAVVEAD